LGARVSAEVLISTWKSKVDALAVVAQNSRAAHRPPSQYLDILLKDFMGILPTGCCVLGWFGSGIILRAPPRENDPLFST